MNLTDNQSTPISNFQTSDSFFQEKPHEYHTKHRTTSSRARQHARENLARFHTADAFARWLPPNGFTGRLSQMDVRPGGTWLVW